MISKFILNKYCHVFDRKNKFILDFCLMIVSYILCFFTFFSGANADAEIFTGKSKRESLKDLSIIMIVGRFNNFVFNLFERIYNLRKLSLLILNREKGAIVLPVGYLHSY